jgi:hypothetical protein
MITLETITPNGDKVMAHAITKALNIGIDELTDHAKKSFNLNIKSAQHILSLEDANKLAHYIQNVKQKLYFKSEEWENHSAIDKLQNLIIFIDKTLQAIDIQIEQNIDILNNSNQAYKGLQHLSTTNNDLLEIKIYLLSKFDFSLEHLKDKLLFMKQEVLEQLDTIDASLSIWDDVELSKQDINFDFTASKIVRLYDVQMKKLNNFSNIDKFFSQILVSLRELQETDEKLATTNKEKLENLLKESYLEEYFEVLYQEWCNETNKINKLYIKVFKAYFVGKISQNVVLEIFHIFQSIKDDLEDFYLTIRSGIVVKYKENPKSELLQQIATKDRIFKIYKNTQPKFIALLKIETSKVSYRFLNTLLGEIIDFKIQEESEGYEEIYQKMAELHSTNLEIYLNDIEVYGKELEKRDMEISKLIFKMQTDLEKKGDK